MKKHVLTVAALVVVFAAIISLCVPKQPESAGPGAGAVPHGEAGESSGKQERWFPKAAPWREDKALTLWNRAVELTQKNAFAEALPVLQELADEYGDTTFGEQAETQVLPQVKRSIVAAELNPISRRLTDNPRDVRAITADIQAAQKRLEQQLPGFNPAREQAAALTERARTAYANLAVEDWNLGRAAKVRALAKALEYGAALEEVRAFAEHWPESDTAQKTAEAQAARLRTYARRNFEVLTANADRLAAAGEREKAAEQLEQVVRHFGIDTYVRQAEARLKALRGK